MDTITRRVVANAYPGHPIPATFTYDRADPLAVRLVFHTSDGVEVIWTFARNLLVLGCSPSIWGWGLGDVRIHRCGPNVGIHLASPDGQLLVHMPVREVSRFVNATVAAVRPGREEYDVDELLTRLLEETP